jgi:hypothetical protein
MRPPPGRDVDPVVPSRPRGLATQRQAGLLGRAAALARVAPPARRNDVLPPVRAALDLRDHVVDVLGVGAAVLAPVPVAQEDGPAVEGHGPCVRNRDVASQPDHRGHVDRSGTRSPRLPELGHRVGGAPEHEHDPAPNGNHRQWLVAGIQYERSRHDGSVPRRRTEVRRAAAATAPMRPRSATDGQ